MSTDYSATFGIGYEVHQSEELVQSGEMEDGLAEYLQEELNSEFHCFETGNAWNGQIDGIFVTIRKPMEYGLDLSNHKRALEDEMERLKVYPISEFDVVGGVMVT